MIAEFISPQDSRWGQLLERTRHDFYHLPEYVQFAAKYEGGMPVAFYAEEGDSALLAPLLVREVPVSLGAPAGWRDATTPYGYPTPLLIPERDSEALERFLQAFNEVAAQQGLISAFFRLHPLLVLPGEVLSKWGTLILHGQTVSIDLCLSNEDSWAQTSRNHRQNIRRLKRLGFRAQMDQWEMFDDFIAIYLQTMERCDADDFYFFDHAYFSELRAVLGDRLHLCTVISPRGEVAAAGLFTVIAGMVQAHLAGTANDFLYCAPSKLMFDHVRWWAKQAGCCALHLGGGVGCRTDSLFSFKAGFSELRSEFFTYRMIIDSEKYAELCRRAREHYQGTDADPAHFPAYRRPQGDNAGAIDRRRIRS